MSGALATANSRRLRTLEPGAARDRAKADVAADIDNLTYVSLADKVRQPPRVHERGTRMSTPLCSRGAQAQCVHDYVKRADVHMRVCGACGLRDPNDPCTKKVCLNELAAEHWLHVGERGAARLRATEHFDLAKLGADGTIESVAVHRTMLHNMACVADGGGNEHMYHVVPEALVVKADEDEDGSPGEGSAPRDCVRLCQHCARSFRCDV